MHSSIKPLVTQASELADRWAHFVERWTTGELPSETPYTRFHGATFNEFSKRVIATLDLVRALGEMEESGQLFFLPKVDNTKKKLDAARTSLDQALNELNARPEAVFKDPNGTLDGVQGFVNGGHVVNANPGTHLDQISANLTALFDLLAMGLKFGKAEGLSVYFRYGEQLQTHAATAKKLHDEVQTLRDASVNMQASIRTFSESISSEAESIRQVKEQVNLVLDAIKAAQAESDAKLAAIRETAKAASSLETQVVGYESSFDAFQKSLDERVAQHSAFEKSMANALSENKTREGEIDRLMQKAESMIQGATTAGLGDSLEKTRKLYQWRMVGVGIGFFVSILLLAASAIPLVAHILPGLFSAWLPQTAAGSSGAPLGPTDALLSLLGKIFLLFPATWLTQFFSKAYSEFFHLEREYAHKAALARSVEGFKKQAPKYEEEITTAVFFEVQSNPSKQKAPDAAEHPIFGPLMKKFIDSLPFGSKPGTKD